MAEIEAVHPRRLRIEAVLEEAAETLDKQPRPLDPTLELQATRLQVCAVGFRERVARLEKQTRLAALDRAMMPVPEALEALLQAERGIVEAACAIHRTLQRRAKASL